MQWNSLGVLQLGLQLGGAGGLSSVLLRVSVCSCAGSILCRRHFRQALASRRQLAAQGLLLHLCANYTKEVRTLTWVSLRVIWRSRIALLSGHPARNVL